MTFQLVHAAHEEQSCHHLADVFSVLEVERLATSSIGTVGRRDK